MSSPVIDAAIDELDAALATIKPIIRGTEDLARPTSIKPTTIEAANAALVRFTRRKEKLAVAVTALRDLQADGNYPELAKEPVAAVEFDDLAEQRSDTEISIDMFVLKPPTVVAGAPTTVDKPV